MPMHILAVFLIVFLLAALVLPLVALIKARAAQQRADSLLERVAALEME